MSDDESQAVWYSEDDMSNVCFDVILSSKRQEIDFFLSLSD